METNYNFKLIDGVFQPTEAQKVLMDLLNTKINYHNLDAFSNFIRFNTETENSKKRVEALVQSSKTIMDIIELATKNNLELKINSNITIELQENVSK